MGDAGKTHLKASQFLVKYFSIFQNEKLEN
jgi:hypothetical protein